MRVAAQIAKLFLCDMTEQEFAPCRVIREPDPSEGRTLLIFYVVEYYGN